MPRLRTDRVSLRPPGQNDFGFLYELAVAQETGFRWRFRGAMISPEQFASVLAQDTLTHAVVEAADGTPIGYCCAFAPDLRSGVVSIGSIAAPSTWMSGLGMDGCLVFVGYVFDVWPMRKLYFETPSFNLDSFFPGSIRRMLVQEGQLTDHIFVDGAYFDQHIFALTRERWQEYCRERRDRSGRAGGTTDSPEELAGLRCAIVKSLSVDVSPLYEFDSLDKTILMALVDDLGGTNQVGLLGSTLRIDDAVDYAARCLSAIQSAG